MTTRKPGVEEEAAPFDGSEAPARAPASPLEARPVKGEIDFKAMRERLTARFPKTLAKLAE